MDSTKQTNFTAPEFSKVFQRIKDKENKQGFYCVRQLNKFHQAQFEQGINSGQINIKNLQSLTISKFADQIQYLNVRIPGVLNDLNELQHASVTFFPTIQNVNVNFAEGRSRDKQMIISQPLIFRGLNVVDENQRGRIEIRCQNHDVQIMDSNFDGIGLLLDRAKKVIVQNSSFRNTPRQGLNRFQTQNTITIDNVQFFNCSTGLQINETMLKLECNNNNNNYCVLVNKMYAEKCRTGCVFQWVRGELKLNDTEIVDCEKGMFLYNVRTSTVQNCNITGVLKKGILLVSSIVKYRHVFIHQSADEIEEEFKKVDLIYSTFTEIF